MTFDEFIKRVQERGGFESREHAEQATRATLAVLGSGWPAASPATWPPSFPASWPSWPAMTDRPSPSTPPSSTGGSPTGSRWAARP